MTVAPATTGVDVFEPAPGARTDLEPRAAAGPRFAGPEIRSDDRLGLTRKRAAENAGLSVRQAKTAIRVAKVPEPEFERLVEADRPPTITALSQYGRPRAPPVRRVYAPFIDFRRALYVFWQHINSEAFIALDDMAEKIKLRDDLETTAVIITDRIIPKLGVAEDATIEKTPLKSDLSRQEIDAMLDETIDAFFGEDGDRSRSHH